MDPEKKQILSHKGRRSNTLRSLDKTKEARKALSLCESEEKDIPKCRLKLGNDLCRGRNTKGAGGGISEIHAAP